ncbi:MAG: enolase C-terminal domain-like protein [Acidimicrobiia bacterium]|nr:enolase C-terminal domain-like protein [Acidimicrobiia bacterium]
MSASRWRAPPTPPSGPTAPSRCSGVSWRDRSSAVWSRPWSATPSPGPRLDGARLDAHLRATGRSLTAFLGGGRRTVGMCAVLGHDAVVDDLVSDVAQLVEEGYRAVSLKIAPGHDREPLTAVRRTFPQLTVAADANGSYGRDDGFLDVVDGLGLSLLEQPLPRDDLVGLAELAARLETPVALDESVDSVGALASASALGAVDALNLKPAAGAAGSAEAASALRHAGARHPRVRGWDGGDRSRARVVRRVRGGRARDAAR